MRQFLQDNLVKVSNLDNRCSSSFVHTNLCETLELDFCMVIIIDADVCKSCIYFNNYNIGLNALKRLKVI